MIIEILIFLSMLFVLVFEYKKTNDLLHPATLLSLEFTIDIAFYLFMKVLTHSKYTLEITTFYFTFGLIVFYIGTLIFTKNVTINIETLKDTTPKIITLIYKLFLLIQFTIIAFFIVDILRDSRVAEKTIFNYIMATRNYQYDEKYWFMVARTISFSLSYLAIYELFSKNVVNRDRIYLVLQIVISLIYMLFMTTRTVWFTFLIPCIILIVLTKYKDNKSLLKYGGALFAIFFMLILVLSLMRGQKGSLEDIRLYLCSGIVQFTNWMKNQGERLNGRYTFRIVFAILNKLNIYKNDVVWVDQTLLKIPGLDWKHTSGNVYTFYHGYAQDFGIWYALFIQFLVGAFHGFIYKMARVKKETFWVVLYAVFMYPLLTQFFSDQYASSMSLWLQITIVLLVACYTNLFYEKRMDIV